MNHYELDFNRTTSYLCNKHKKTNHYEIAFISGKLHFSTVMCLFSRGRGTTQTTRNAVCKTDTHHIELCGK